jgi:hypothetical protein
MFLLVEISIEKDMQKDLGFVVMPFGPIPLEPQTPC